MQEGTHSNEPHDAVIAHRLADMHTISWQEAIAGEQTLLRVARPSDELLSALQQRFCLDELHIKDICNPNHPAHLTRLENDAVHIILRFPTDKESNEDQAPVTSVSILADKTLLCLIWPEQRHHRFSLKYFAGLSIDEMLCRIIHTLVDHLLRRVHLLREEVDDFEDVCFEDVSKADLTRLLNMRRELAAMARLANTNAHAIEQLQAMDPHKGSVVLHDAYEHMQRAAALAESKAEHALNVMQAVQSLLSQRLNDVMKFLAVITVVLTPMGVIAGIFGMNFTHMEVLAHPNGFALSIWGMILLAVVLAILFKVRKWW